MTEPTKHAKLQGGSWYIPAADNMVDFSAVCWTHLNVLIGLIQNQVGGTAVEKWPSKAALSQCNQRRGTRMAKRKASGTFEGEFESLHLVSEGFCSGNSDSNSSLYNGMTTPQVYLLLSTSCWLQDVQDLFSLDSSRLLLIGCLSLIASVSL